MLTSVKGVSSAPGVSHNEYLFNAQVTSFDDIEHSKQWLGQYLTNRHQRPTIYSNVKFYITKKLLERQSTSCDRQEILELSVPKDGGDYLTDEAGWGALKDYADHMAR